MKVFDGGLNPGLPVYIGIDQSYSGFAITALNDTGHFTTVYKSDLRGVDRLVDIQAHVQATLFGFDVIDVAIEGYAFGSQMANMLGELGGAVKITLQQMGVYPLIVPPTTLKKYACGKGQGVSKSQIMLSVYKNFGAEFTDDNAADSYVLAHIVSGKHSRAYEREVYDKLQDVKFREK